MDSFPTSWGCCGNETSYYSQVLTEWLTRVFFATHCDEHVCVCVCVYGGICVWALGANLFGNYVEGATSVLSWRHLGCWGVS